MVDVLVGLIKAIIIVPIMIAWYLLMLLIVSLVFIGIALVVSAPFILIIGLVLWIFF